MLFIARYNNNMKILGNMKIIKQVDTLPLYYILLQFLPKLIYMPMMLVFGVGAIVVSMMDRLAHLLHTTTLNLYGHSLYFMLNT